MRIGILICGRMSDEMRKWQGYDVQFQDLLRDFDFEFTSYAAIDGELPANIDAQDGWIITGSKHSTYDDLPWIAPLEGFLREIYSAGAPIVGICFGHQILAQALGGVNEKFAGGWNIGRQEYRLSSGGSCAVMAWHQDQVTSLPRDAQVIASSQTCANAILHYPGHALTIQSHPEFNAEFTQDLLDKRSAGVPDVIKAQAADHMQEPLSTQTIAAAMAQFLRTKTVQIG